MELVTWNIQFGKGCDEKIDLVRIAARIKDLGDPDVICLQEVARFVPDLALEADCDQVSALSDHFRNYEPVFGPAVDYSSGRGLGVRQQFGNLILSRLPVLQIFQHSLPQPPDPAVKHMPRQATEVVVEAEGRQLRVMTTHLEFHSEIQRLSQALRLQQLQNEVQANTAAGRVAAEGIYGYSARPDACLLCGDFNAEPGDAVYGALTGAAFTDSWRTLRPQEAHAPTCGIFDKAQWPQGPHCRDYFLASAAAVPALREIEVDTETDASDHQPIRLAIDPSALPEAAR